MKDRFIYIHTYFRISAGLQDNFVLFSREFHIPGSNNFF